MPVKQEHLLQVLKIQDEDIATEDMKYVLRRSHSMEHRGLSQARSLMAKSTFKEFLAKGESGLLMVDGHGKSDGAGKTSPLSVWSASFVASLTQSDSITALHFFCGLHARSDSDDPYCGPVGLVKSLAVQLLRCPGDQLPSLGPIDQALLDDLDNDNFESICELFRILVLSLNPEKILFVIIDNISEFEGVTWTAWHDQAHLIFDLLHGMVQTDTDATRRRARLKVLITSANKATSLGRSVKDHESVALRSP